MSINRLHEFGIISDNRSSGPTVISLVSGKGGVGKSVLAFNIGAILASHGEKTLIMDCDYHFGNIHILGNVIPSQTLANVIEDVEMFSGSLTPVCHNLDLLASQSGTGNYHEFKSLKFRRLLEQLRGLAADYRYVILDTTSGHLELIRQATEYSDFNLIILNPELTSIADAYGLFKFLVKLKKDFSAHIFLNNIESESDYEYVYQKFTVLAGKFIGRVPLNAGYLYSDRHVIESISKQRSLVELFPDSPAVKQLSNLCRILTGKSEFRGGDKTVKFDDNINSIKALADIKE
ncbi:MAG: AAA family ATPase [Candidatus Zixiibacteriota bacterium]